MMKQFAKGFTDMEWVNIQSYCLLFCIFDLCEFRVVVFTIVYTKAASVVHIWLFSTVCWYIVSVFNKKNDIIGIHVVVGILWILGFDVINLVNKYS